MTSLLVAFLFFNIVLSIQRLILFHVLTLIIAICPTKTDLPPFDKYLQFLYLINALVMEKIGVYFLENSLNYLFRAMIIIQFEIVTFSRRIVLEADWCLYKA